MTPEQRKIAKQLLLYYTGGDDDVYQYSHEQYADALTALLAALVAAAERERQEGAWVQVAAIVERWYGGNR